MPFACYAPYGGGLVLMFISVPILVGTVGLVGFLLVIGAEALHCRYWRHRSAPRRLAPGLLMLLEPFAALPADRRRLTLLTTLPGRGAPPATYLPADRGRRVGAPNQGRAT